MNAERLASWAGMLVGFIAFVCTVAACNHSFSSSLGVQ